MNIAILIPTLTGGGAERVAQVIGNYYAERGNKVYYFIADTDIRQAYPVKGEVVQTGIKSCMSGTASDILRMIKLFLSSLRIRKLKIKYRIEVAISFMEEFNYLNVLSKGREKVIVRICTILSREDLKGFLYKRKIVRFFYSKADKVIVMSCYALNEMRCHYGISKKKLVKIPNPIMDFRESERNAVLWEFGTKAVLCVGRLEPVKQQERIIRAFSYVVQKENQARLVILGKGCQLGYLQRLCEKYKIEGKVIFEGFTNELPYFYHNARVFVMASKAEGFPNSMIEAMSYGVPIVTTDSLGACGEIVGKEKAAGKVDEISYCRYGILTPDIQSEKLKVNSELTEQEILLGKAMLEVLTNDKIYERYHMQSYKRADMFRTDKVMKKWEEIILSGK